MANPRTSESNFPSTMDFQDLLDMSSTVPEECASTLPTANAQAALPSEAGSSVPDREIKYEDPLTHKIGTLCDTTMLSDVTFIVGEEKCEIKAHKMILALSSPVFTAMFYGELASKQPVQRSVSGNNLHNSMTVIEVPDCAPRAFKTLLQFIYKGDEPSLTVDHALSLLYTSRKYAVRGLEDKCCVVLSSSITADNVFDILYAATFYNLSGLGLKCWEFMEDNPVDVLNAHLDFLTHETMQSVLKNDKLNANEVELFQVTVRWAEMMCRRKEIEVTPENIRKNCEAELKLIRFPAMSGQEFADHVVPTKILTVDQVAKIFTIMNTSDEKKDTMSDLLSSEFSDKKRVPKVEVIQTSADSSTPPVFTFIAQQIERDNNSAGSTNQDPNRAVMITGPANPENILALLGVDGVAAVAVPVPVPLPGNIPSVISQAGDRNRTRRPRRSRRRSLANNNEIQEANPRQ